jgi:hypothetical protein
VKLEKQADIVIADHAKKDCPPGSISWKYIQDSVKDGELKDIEEYRAGSSTHSPRAVGSSQPVKKGRTPFTVEDDRVLADWVLNAERSGLKTRGNEIYQQLEAMVRVTYVILVLFRYRPNGVARITGIPPSPGVTVGSSIFLA